MAPRLVFESSALISRSIAWTRRRLESVPAIEPESSMIASTLVTRLQTAALRAPDACPELGTSTATIRPPSISPRTERELRMCRPSLSVGASMGQSTRNVDPRSMQRALEEFFEALVALGDLFAGVGAGEWREEHAEAVALELELERQLRPGAAV